MKVYLVLDISRGAQPVLGCWTCAVDAVESAKQFPNAFVVRRQYEYDWCAGTSVP
jgi:hypothetical protein